MTCTEPAEQTVLSKAQALAVLEPYFIAAQEAFVSAGYHECSKVKFAVSADMHDTPRHFAGAYEDGSRIVFAPQAVDLPESTVLAIMFHEFGHICDFCRPACHFFGRNGLMVRKRSDWDEKQWMRWLRVWNDRDHDAVERTADAIAEAVSGATIGYSGPCMLQTFSGGVSPRPSDLR